MSPNKKVLITGSAGRIGTVLRQALHDKYDLSGIDRAPVPGFDSAVADLTDLAAVAQAFRGKDVVLHLAAEPRHTPDIGWDVLLPDNIVATANVFEAASQEGVSRVIFFSSMHVNGLYERDYPFSAIAQGEYGVLDPDGPLLVTRNMPVRPDGPYAATKVFGEGLGRYYAEELGISVICIRLGTIGADDRPGDDARSYVSWCSHRDLASMVERAIDAEGISFEILYGASNNKWKIYDTPTAWRVLDYRPQDNAEAFRPGVAANTTSVAPSWRPRRATF